MSSSINKTKNACKKTTNQSTNHTNKNNIATKCSTSLYVL